MLSPHSSEYSNLTKFCLMICMKGPSPNCQSSKGIIVQLHSMNSIEFRMHPIHKKKYACIMKNKQRKKISNGNVYN